MIMNYDDNIEVINTQEGFCTLDVYYFLALLKTTTCDADSMFICV
jgi:hypothetical protein